MYRQLSPGYLHKLKFIALLTVVRDLSLKWAQVLKEKVKQTTTKPEQ